MAKQTLQTDCLWMQRLQQVRLFQQQRVRPVRVWAPQARELCQQPVQLLALVRVFALVVRVLALVVLVLWAQVWAVPILEPFQARESALDSALGMMWALRVEMLLVLAWSAWAWVPFPLLEALEVKLEMV